jgi:hypothetical protein
LIAVRLIPREEWEAELRHYGCRPLQGKTKLNTAEWWRMPWQDYPFTVPVQPGGMMRPEDLQDRIVLIAQSAPEGTTFPYD